MHSTQRPPWLTFCHTPTAARAWACARQALGLDGEAKGDGQATYLMYAASFLDKVYPGRGMSSSLRMEHIKNMGASDFYKVWKARRHAAC